METAAAPADPPDLVEIINSIIRFSVAATIVLTAITAAFEIRRLVRMSRPDGAT